MNYPAFPRFCRALLNTLPLAILVEATGCSVPMGGDEYLPPATEILEIRIEPNPVVQNEDVTFTVVTPDTAKAGFKYTWLGLVLGGAETMVPRYTWKATVPPGDHHGEVQVSRGADYEQVGKIFTVTVIPKP